MSSEATSAEAGALKGLTFSRFFTKPNVHPFDAVTWEIRDARIDDGKGKVTFEQKGVEVPSFWSQRATNIVAEKYFRVCDGVKENSAKMMINRVADTIADKAWGQGLFKTKSDYMAFKDELMHILVHQMFAFNSPVWFNIGVPGVKQQASACFIQKVDDTMEDITELIGKEMRLFKGGSGTGTNFSTLRSSYEKLSGGGEASGPVSFMEVLDAGAGVTKSGGTTRRAAKMAILNVDHPDILTQKSGRPGFITCKAAAEKMAHDLIDMGYPGEFHKPGNVYEKVGFQNANNSVRVTDEFMHAVAEGAAWHTRAVATGDIVAEYGAAHLWEEIAKAAWFCGDPGLQYDTTINEWHTCKASGRINGSNPCSEYMFLDDTACNLGSFNLLKFYDGKRFNAAAFAAANKVCITAMEALVGFSSYPSEAIEKNSHLFRPLGIGYANLGALLMSMGLAYDSDEGRQVAAAITALMSGVSYAQSALMAEAVGPFPEFQKNRASMLEVIRMHTAATSTLRLGDIDPELGMCAQQAWEEALMLGEQYGYRNSQISVLAPTGTISFLMDCDTTGLEPMLALLVFKKLVGGGMLTMPNEAVAPALKNLGYAAEDIKEICEHIKNTNGGLPAFLRAEHVKVFQTAIGSDPVTVEGHLKMMAAVQPFLSGAISKTVNMPSSTTVADVMHAYQLGWELGLKAVAIYRDGCKKSQPASSKITEASALKPLKTECAKCKKELQVTEITCGNCSAALKWGQRKRLEDDRQSLTHKFSIGGQEGYLHVGLYPDGTPGELFVNIAKAGSTLHGIVDMAATAISIGLQHGVPVQTLIDKFKGTQFQPAGFTQYSKIRNTSSIGDYIARYFEEKFTEHQQELFEESAVSPVQESPAKIDSSKLSLHGDPCRSCGNMTQRAGSCWVCTACGTTTGCG